MVKHDCPYESYGEPCQCNRDWLETLGDDEEDEDEENTNDC